MEGPQLENRLQRQLENRDRADGVLLGGLAFIFMSFEEALNLSQSYRVAILGATGAVGTELMELLEERKFPISELKLLSSPRSAGQQPFGLLLRMQDAFATSPLP